MWVGIDDTDSPRGGCTTYALTQVIDAAAESGLNLIGEPRLVRLNPNIPFKTRGNAALAAKFGHGFGPRRRQGKSSRGTVWSYARGRAPSVAEREGFLERAWAAVRANSMIGEPGTDPVLIATDRPPPAALYRSAVSRLVPVGQALELLDHVGADVFHAGSQQGAVGASSAVAWPGRRATWELIAYREENRRATPRFVDPDSVRLAQSRHPSLFLCYDERTRRLLVAPHTSCPILLGLRSSRREGLAQAFREVIAEPVERWLIFRTNQGTGDHLVPRGAAEFQPYDAGRVRGWVRGNPRILPGGHATLTIVDAAGAGLSCVAFEPTKTLPRVVSRLMEGDRVEVWGGRGSDATFRLEGLRLISLARRRGSPTPPRCDTCQRTARSMGTGRGYRCSGCHRRLPPESARWSSVTAPRPGTFHPTASARRHLAPRGPEPGP